MMDRIKQNPFLSGCIGAALAIIVVGGYLVGSEAGRYGEEQTSFADTTMLLQRLERNKPFPDASNVGSAEKEVKETGSLLTEVAAELAVEAPQLTPQAFQDELNKLVKNIRQLAQARGVALPGDFYLGFETYETQPPASNAAATELGLQLRSIHAVTETLVNSGVAALGPIVRAPLPAEAAKDAPEEPEDGKKNRKQKKKDKGEDSTPAFSMAPFNINFTADQSAFRLAFNDILAITPPVFVRLVAIENSASAPPSKAASAEAAPDEPAEAGTIKALFGREKLTVHLRLASIGSSPSQP